MATQIMQKEGVPGYYRGFIPSAIKNLPNKGAASFLQQRAVNNFHRSWTLYIHSYQKTLLSEIYRLLQFGPPPKPHENVQALD